MGLTTVEPTATVQEVIDVIERDGGVIIRDFIDQETVAGLEHDLRPHLDATPFGEDDPEFAGVRTRRVGALFKHTRHADPVARHPLYRGAAEHYLCNPDRIWLGADPVEVASAFQIGVTGAADLYPGETPQPLHRDDSVWHWPHPEGGGRQARVQIMVAISDFTADNGATNVIPGSHKWGDDRAPLKEEAVPAVMSAGSALIFIGGTFHGGGENSSKERRTSLSIAFDLAYLRQEENHYLSIPVELAKGIPDDIARDLGYQASPPLIGWVEIDGVMSDPHVLLEGGDTKTTAAPIGTKVHA